MLINYWMSDETVPNELGSFIEANACDILCILCYAGQKGSTLVSLSSVTISGSN